MKRVLLYKTGESAPALARDVGDYERWFARVLDGIVRLELHLAFAGAPRPPGTTYDGVLVTGSPRSLVAPEPWMDEAAAFIRDVAAAGVPVLGVCFGHQLVGYAFGGAVRPNPRGWEVGSHEVALTDDGLRDPLFRDLPARLRVNQSHRDEVWPLGSSTRPLAANAHSPAQAIGVGEHVRGVQFHPEIDAVVMRRLIAERRALLADECARRGACLETLLAGAADTPDGERVLVNFVEAFVRAA